MKDPKHNWGWGDRKVGKGPEVNFGDTNGIFSMDFTDDAIHFKFNDVGLFTTHSQNGNYFWDKYNVLAPIVGFNLTTNMHGLTKSDISFTSDSMLIDWQGGSFTPDTYVIVDVIFAREIKGTSKANALKGSKHIDFITGGKGADTLTGGKGADHFVFRKGDTGNTKKSADLITDFSTKSGDVIDLHLWDANSKVSGVQDFDFIGKRAFTKEAGQLRYQKSGSETLLMGDTNGDGKTDLMIRLKGSIILSDDSFLF